MNKQEFIVREHMLQWVHMEVGKLGFGVVIVKFDNGLDRRQAFVAMRCEKSGMYQPRTRKLKRDGTGSRKCECLFKLHVYHMTDETWKINVISSIHNHALTDKLVGHPVVCRLIPGESELVSDMTLNMMAPKNIHPYFKRKNPLNVSNIKKIYNVRARNNKVVRGQRYEIQQLFKFLEDDDYVSR